MRIKGSNTLIFSWAAEFTLLLEKTIHEEEGNNVDHAEPMHELKVNDNIISLCRWNWQQRAKAKLEAQYVARQQAHVAEVQDLKQQIELKAAEVRNLNSTIDSLKGVNEELKVCLSPCYWRLLMCYGG